MANRMGVQELRYPIPQAPDVHVPLMASRLARVEELAVGAEPRVPSTNAAMVSVRSVSAWHVDVPSLRPRLRVRKTVVRVEQVVTLAAEAAVELARAPGDQLAMVAVPEVPRMYLQMEAVVYRLEAIKLEREVAPEV
jgi:hypothetical protein